MCQYISLTFFILIPPVVKTIRNLRVGVRAGRPGAREDGNICCLTVSSVQPPVRAGAKNKRGKIDVLELTFQCDIFVLNVLLLFFLYLCFWILSLTSNKVSFFFIIIFYLTVFLLLVEY